MYHAICMGRLRKRASACMPGAKACKGVLLSIKLKAGAAACWHKVLAVGWLPMIADNRFCAVHTSGRLLIQRCSLVLVGYRHLSSSPVMLPTINGETPSLNAQGTPHLRLLGADWLSLPTHMQSQSAFRGGGCKAIIGWCTQTSAL